MMTSFMAWALVTQAGAPAVPIDAAEANWAGFPRLERSARPLPTASLVGRVETILSRRQCQVAGQTASRFDFDVPFAVLLRPDGSVERAIVKDMDCPEIETLVGEIAVEMGRQGDYRPTRQTETRWYGDVINFNLQN